MQNTDPLFNTIGCHFCKLQNIEAYIVTELFGWVLLEVKEHYQSQVKKPPLDYWKQQESNRINKALCKAPDGSAQLEWNQEVSYGHPCQFVSCKDVIRCLKQTLTTTIFQKSFAIPSITHRSAFRSPLKMTQRLQNNKGIRTGSRDNRKSMSSQKITFRRNLLFQEIMLCVRKFGFADRGHSCLFSRDHNGLLNQTNMKMPFNRFYIQAGGKKSYAHKHRVGDP